MKKALLGAALAALLVPNLANASAGYAFTIVGSTAAQGATAAPCANASNPLGAPTCQKTTVSRHARCAYLTDKATAQDSSSGKLGYVFKIDPTKTNSYDAQTAVNSGSITDGNNYRFDLKVVDWAGGAPVSNIGGTPADVPDVDIAFYISLGNCQGQPSTAIPTVGENPTQPDSSSPFFPPGSYMGFGDELGKQFPSSRYINDLNKPRTSTTMWAIVTVIGGPNTKVSFYCSACLTGAITPA